MKPLANELASVFGATRITAGENSEAALGDGVKLALRLVSRSAGVAFLQPVAYGQIENRGHRHLAEPRFALEVRL